MKFVVFAAALNGEGQMLDFIDGLIDRLADQVHRVEVPEADLLQESSWYQAARSTRRKVLTSALANPPRRSSSGLGPHVKKVEITDFRSAQQAHKLAHTPLVILVEDREADGVMLEILVEELGWPTLRELWIHGQSVTPRAFEIDSAGGIGSIPQRVARAADDAVKEGRPIRLFVLCDSDARWPGDEQKGVGQRRLLRRVEGSRARYLQRARHRQRGLAGEGAGTGSTTGPCLLTANDVASNDTLQDIIKLNHRFTREAQLLGGLLLHGYSFH